MFWPACRRGGQLTSQPTRRAYLQHVQQVLLGNVRELDVVGGVDDGVQLGELVGDALERRLSVCHTVENTAQ